MRRLLYALCALALACGNTSPGPRKLVILHTNDEHSHLLGAGPEQDDLPPPITAGTGSIKGGIARRLAVLKSERDAAKAAGAAHLTVSAGDNMMGTLTQVAALSASPDYRLMKMLGYDVTTLGNHEFDYGPGALAAIIATAKASNEGLPAIVASNIVFGGATAAGDDSALAALYDDFGTNPSAPIRRGLVLTTSNGLRIGFVGIMGADAAAVAPLKAPTHFSVAYGQSDSNRLAALSQIFDDIQPVVDQLHRDMGAQVVVALSHGGLDPNNLASSEDYLIAQNVSGIDVIVSGHSHTEGSASVTNLRSGEKVFVQQAGRYGDNVGRISLTVDGSGNVSVDPSASQLIKVDDTIVASDASVNAFVAKVIGGLETPAAGSSTPSFLQFTLVEALALTIPPPPNPDIPGALYNYSLGGLDFDVDNTGRVMETSLLDLSADAQLAAVSKLRPGGVDAALEASGVLRVSKIEKAKSGTLAFGDVFRAVPLGATPATSGPSAGTPGYPLCLVGIYLAEMKAVFETTAGFAYAGHDDFYVVPAGFKFEYDTSRPAFNPNGDALDMNNGRVTKISKLRSADLAAGNYDGNYDVVFDVSTSGWVPGAAAPAGPLTLVRVAASLYMATFAATAGVHLKDAVTGLPISGATPTAIASSTILHRASSDPACDSQGRCTEVKVWEALAAYVKAQSGTGKLPSRYDKTVATLPRRAACVGVNSSNPSGGNCTH